LLERFDAHPNQTDQFAPRILTTIQEWQDEREGFAPPHRRSDQAREFLLVQEA
jgi:hypothetical protein